MTLITKYRQHIIYLVLVVLTVISYPFMVRLLAVQTAWVDINVSNFTVSMVAALLIWSWATDKLSKKRKWSSRKSWAVSLSGIVLLILFATWGN